MSTKLSHIVARRYILPRLPPSATPNHITTLRLLTGLAACAMVAAGGEEPTTGTTGTVWMIWMTWMTWMTWGAFLWTLSCFLDRVDGALARERGMTSSFGHAYDYGSDAVCNAAFFIAAGLAVPLPAAPFLGFMAASGIVLASWCAERTSRLRGGAFWKGYGGGWFDADDIAYLYGPVILLGGLPWLLIAAALGAPLFAVAALLLLYRRRKS